MADHEEHDHEHDHGEEEEEEVMQRFWGAVVEPTTGDGQGYAVSLHETEVHITQACIAAGPDVKKHAVLSVVSPTIGVPIRVATLHSQSHPQALLDLSFFPDDESVTLIVEGNAAVHVSGSVAIYGSLPDSEDEDEDADAAASKDADMDTSADASAASRAGSKRARVEVASAPADADAEAPEGKPASIPIDLPSKPLTAAEKLRRQKAEAASEAAAVAPQAKGGKKGKAAETVPAAAPETKGGKQQQVAAAPAAVPEAKAGTKRRAEDAPVEAAAAVKKERGADAEEPALKPLVGGKVQFRDDVVGTGKTPVKGHKVVVAYTGMLPNGKVFDKSSSFDFRIGTGSVIQGWDVGVASMRVGGKRRLVIHPTFGYGAEGAPPAIPPNATLIFDVQLLAAH